MQTAITGPVGLSLTEGDPVDHIALLRCSLAFLRRIAAGCHPSIVAALQQGGFAQHKVAGKPAVLQQFQPRTQGRTLQFRHQVCGGNREGRLRTALDFGMPGL